MKNNWFGWHTVIYAQIILMVIGVMMLGGCATKPPIKQIEVSTTAIEKLPLSLSNPAPLDMEEVEWMIVTEDNIDEAWQLLKDKNEGVALFALRSGDYERLALNIKEIRALLGKYIVILTKYREYYEEK